MSSYMLLHLRDEWRRRGHHVQIVKGLRQPMPAADAAIQHVDMTVVPPEYVQALESYPIVINRRVTDVGKPVFSESIIRRDDPWSGPVIVKTRNNYGGLVEAFIRRAEGKPQPRLKDKVPWRNRLWLREYEIFNATSDVPDGVWENENLIVEKFLPERDEDGTFRLRVWIFLGNRELHYMSMSREPIIKSTNTIRRDGLPLEDVPDKLRHVRRILGFDYGKFDYAIHEGDAVLYDVNKTPGVPRELRNDPGTAENLRLLSLGLESLLEPVVNP